MPLGMPMMGLPMMGMPMMGAQYLHETLAGTPMGKTKQIQRSAKVCRWWACQWWTCSKWCKAGYNPILCSRRHCLQPFFLLFYIRIIYIYIHIINIIYIYIYRDLAAENLENPKNLHNNIIHLGASTSSTIPSHSLPGGQMAGASVPASLSCNALVFVYFHLGPLAIPKPSNSSTNPTLK